MFFTIYGRGGHLGHVNKIPRTNFCSTAHGCSTQNLAFIGQAVIEKKMFENVNGRTHARLLYYEPLG